MQQLTQGCLETIYTQQLASSNSNLRPVLQCLEIIPSSSQPKRYRLILSDGKYKFSNCLASSQLTDVMDNAGITANCILTLTDYASHEAKQKTDGSGRVIVILGIDQNIQPCGAVIGNPVDLLQGLQSGNILPGNQGQGTGSMQASNMYPTNNTGSMQAGMGMGSTNQQAGNFGNNMSNNNNPGTNYNQVGNNQVGGFNQGGNNQGAGFNQGGGGFNQQQPPMQNQTYGNQPQQLFNTGGVVGGGYTGGGAIATNTGAGGRVMPISHINPYMNRLVIKGRITMKSEKRFYNNAKGDGQLFSFEIVDSSSDLRVTGFNAECEKFYDLIEVGAVYQISKGTLKPKRAQYNSTSHPFELTLGRDSEITRVQDDSQLPTGRYNFQAIQQIESVETGQIVDVIGVVDTCTPVADLVKRDGTPLKKRSVIIKDDSQRSVEVTLWGKYTEEPGNQLEQMVGAGGGQPVILAVKGARVGDYSGKTLSTVSSTSLALNPALPQAEKLKKWYASGGNVGNIQSLSSAAGLGAGGRRDRRVTVKIIQNENLGMDGNRVWVVVRGYVTNVLSSSLTYPGCPLQFQGKDCNKKITNENGANWHCSRCMSDVPQPKYRWMMSLGLVDETGDLSPLQVFGEVGDALTGLTADEYERKQAQGIMSENEVSNLIVCREMLFKIKIMQDTYNDETRMKYMVTSVEPINWTTENQFLSKQINSMVKGEQIMPPQNAAPPSGMNNNNNNNNMFGGNNNFGGAPGNNNFNRGGNFF